jgi:CBS domain-containing protein
MTVEALLRRKGGRIISIGMGSTAAAAAKLLRSENISALVVKDCCSTEGDVVLGMLSERDVLQALVSYGTNVIAMPVAALMTGNVICCVAQNSLSHVADLMRCHHVRHVPVMDREAWFRSGLHAKRGIPWLARLRPLLV